MNKTQKKRLNEILSLLVDVREGLEELHSELETKYDSHSEKWQESEKGEELNDIISAFDNAITDIENVEYNIADYGEE